MPSTDDLPTPAEGAEPAAGAAGIRRENQHHLHRALLLAIVVGAVIDAVLIVLAATLLDGPALRGALVGTGLALVVTVPTLLSARITRDRDPMMSAAVLVGAWLVKMFVLVIVLLLLQDVDGISRPWIGIALLAGAVAAAVTEALALLARRPRLEVEPPSVGQ
ncbi:hypothetical protein [Brachybacterium phenoliresistens]|uniref:ATP synthase n=1 Tax=Brachybacterium phenoliresistens TaxID=396014 RepID=Z9JXD1_9MICO|nr:hypothetical protein [Brachybacterium phenoliresistens]EWS83010.1 hypothetical protein BF93_00125 [Brachybacterium phenoliresistens]